MRTPLLIATLVLASCQAYDFERVEPLFYRRITNPVRVKGVRPDVLVLLDRSGSMGFPINPLDTSACPANCGDGTNPCPASCPTRISELRAAMPVFFNAAKDQARFGLALFPQGKGSANQCVATNSSLIPEPLPADGPETTANLALWAAQTDRISSFISATMPEKLVVGGGTPTAASLDFIGTTPGLAQEGELKRQRIVLLLTDGLPNCRPGDPNAIDMTAVNSVAALLTKGIRTIVIGFGSDANGATVLSDMARAGGFAKRCTAATATRDCGSGDSCGTDGICGRAAYSASNAAELKVVLETLRKKIGGTDPCVVDLGSLPYENIVVALDDKELIAGPNAWNVAGRTLTFLGSSCDLIQNSSDSAPVKIDIGVY